MLEEIDNDLIITSNYFRKTTLNHIVNFNFHINSFYLDIIEIVYDNFNLVYFVKDCIHLNEIFFVFNNYKVDHDIFIYFSKVILTAFCKNKIKNILINYFVFNTLYISRIIYLSVFRVDYFVDPVKDNHVVLDI